MVTAAYLHLEFKMQALINDVNHQQDSNNCSCCRYCCLCCHHCCPCWCCPNCCPCCCYDCHSCCPYTPCSCRYCHYCWCFLRRCCWLCLVVVNESASPPPAGVAVPADSPAMPFFLHSLCYFSGSRFCWQFIFCQLNLLILFVRLLDS